MDAAKLEGDSGATAFNFTVTRSDGSGAASVNYAVSGDIPDPADAVDFVGGVLPSGTVNFADGQTSVPLVINVQGDIVEEFDERFKVVLSDPSEGAVIDVGEALGIIIQNDDAAPVAVAGGPYEVFEASSIVLDASGTEDIDEPNSALTFEWDLDNDGAYDDATGIFPDFLGRRIGRAQFTPLADRGIEGHRFGRLVRHNDSDCPIKKCQIRWRKWTATRPTRTRPC